MNPMLEQKWKEAAEQRAILEQRPPNSPAPDCQPTYAQVVPITNPLKEAKEILTMALCDVGVLARHSSNCSAGKFARNNRYLPANHPAWRQTPKCDCWVGAAAEWLKNNPEI